MSHSFLKIHACGNDFVLLTEHPQSEAIPRICDRHHGLGADGILVFTMTEAGPELAHYDPDGGRTFCLNGLRASLDALHQQGTLPASGVIHSEGASLSYRVAHHVQVHLPKVPYRAVTFQDEAMGVPGFFAQVGNPQFVTLTPRNRDHFLEVAPFIRHSTTFSDTGCNVNWLAPQEDGWWRVVTFERGVEDVTLACGSGMYACALVLFGEHNLTSVTFQPDGEGSVTVTDTGSELLFEGPTTLVARGEWLC